MLEKIPAFLQKLIENYLDFFAAACYQRNQLAVQLFRIAVIINGLQELSLMEDNLHQCDTILFYSSLKESLPTTQLIGYESKSTLSILLITHIIINLLIFVNLFFIKKQSYFHTVTLSIILVENYILLYPTLKAIFYFNKLQADYEIYLISIFNLIMYVQIAITQYSWRQTKLIDLQGLVRTNNLKLELLSHLILMLAVGFNELSKTGSYILIMIKQIIKLGLSFDSYNQNSQFMLYYNQNIQCKLQNVTQIIFMAALYFNIDMIYTLLIFGFFNPFYLRIIQYNLRYPSRNVKFMNQYLINPKIHPKFFYCSPYYKKAFNKIKKAKPRKSRQISFLPINRISYNR